MSALVRSPQAPTRGKHAELIERLLTLRRSNDPAADELAQEVGGDICRAWVLLDGTAAIHLDAFKRWVALKEQPSTDAIHLEESHRLWRQASAAVDWALVRFAYLWAGQAPPAAPGLVSIDECPHTAAMLDALKD